MPVNASDHWSEYWSQGRLTSLPQDFAANYDGEVEAFWVEAFGKVPGDGHVVDLCTGNGAIALLAAKHFQLKGVSPEITAVDAAAMDPAAVARAFPGQAGLTGSINFLGHTRVEQLGLPDACADLVTSQYGIEYCEWQRAAEQVSRILKPGGRFVMVCHTPTSDMLKYMEREHAEYAQLDELGFFTAVDAYLEGDSDAGDLQEKFSVIGSELQAEFSRSGSALLRSVLGLIHNASGLTAGQLDSHRAALNTYQRQMRAGRDRLADMLRVNRALDENPEWVQVFIQAGLDEVRRGQIRYRGQHNAGQYFEFSRSRSEAQPEDNG